MKKREVIMDSSNLIMTYLRGVNYTVVFLADIYKNVANVSIAVGANDSEAELIFCDMKDGIYKVTGNGSISALRHVADYLTGEFLSICKSRKLDGIRCVGADGKRTSAYRWLTRYGFIYSEMEYIYPIVDSLIYKEKGVDDDGDRYINYHDFVDDTGVPIYSSSSWYDEDDLPF